MGTLEAEMKGLEKQIEKKEKKKKILSMLSTAKKLEQILSMDQVGQVICIWLQSVRYLPLATLNICYILNNKWFKKIDIN